MVKHFSKGEILSNLPPEIFWLRPRKGYAKSFQSRSRKEPSLEVSRVRLWIFTPKIEKTMIGGGGPVAKGA